MNKYIFLIILLPIISYSKEFLSYREVQEDITFLRKTLKNQWSYYNYEIKNQDELAKRLLDAFSEEQKKNLKEDFKIQILRYFGEFYDPLATIKDWKEKYKKKMLPVSFNSTKDGIIVLTENQKLLNPEYPFLKKIEDIPLKEYLKVLNSFIPNGTKELFEVQSFKLLRYFSFVQKIMNLPDQTKVTMTLENKDKKQKKHEIFLNENKSISFNWPYKISSKIKLADGEIGYLRISEMREDSKYIKYLHDRMDRFKKSKGLIIDIRGTTDSQKRVVKEIIPYFLNPNQYRVISLLRRRGKDNVSNLVDNYYQSLFEPIRKNISRNFLKKFKAEWDLSPIDFSPWEMFIIGGGEQRFYYPKRVVLLQDKRNSGASEVLLSGLKGLENIFLMGERTSGSIGDLKEFELPNSKIKILISNSMYFQRNGYLYNNYGVKPDIKIKYKVSDFIGKSDSFITKAIYLLTK